jgi:sterol 3beta-glucosyltransferase
MHVYIIGMGTRGDIQPYIALGLGVQKAGHRVTFCTSENFRSFVVEYGLPCTSVYDDLQETMSSDAGRAVLDDSTPARQAPHFAEKLGIPAMIAAVAPGFVPTSAFPAGVFPPWRLGGWYNRWTAKLMVKFVAMGVPSTSRRGGTRMDCPRFVAASSSRAR